MFSTSDTRKFYNLHKKDFIRQGLALTYNQFNISVMEDVYQESIIELFNNVKSGKYDPEKSSLANYFFGVFRRQLMTYANKKENQHQNKFDVEDKMFEIEQLNEEPEEWKQKQEIVYEMVSNMGEPCNMVLKLYYWEQKSMKEIAQNMSYKNEQVAKNKKHSCLSKLKERLKVKLQGEELI